MTDKTDLLHKADALIDRKVGGAADLATVKGQTAAALAATFKERMPLLVNPDTATVKLAEYTISAVDTVCDRMAENLGGRFTDPLAAWRLAAEQTLPELVEGHVAHYDAAVRAKVGGPDDMTEPLAREYERTI